MAKTPNNPSKWWLFRQRLRTAWNVIRAERFYIYYTMPGEGDDYHANWQALRVMDANQIKAWGTQTMEQEHVVSDLLDEANTLLGLPTESDD